ncbi:hypothetical protein [Micromonospora sp. NPDC126480]|uniref:hypothetical protein n=1 Tax=Micromonospora sp. NPDC126480 TaxID=3155312 RepID=UPI00331F17C2
MAARWDDPLNVAGRADDEDRSASTERGADRDRPERTLEHDDPPAGPDRPEGTAGTLDRAEERAATDDASLRERLQAGAQRGGELAAAVLVSAAGILGWQETDDRLPVQAAANASEAIGEAASAAKDRRDRDDAVEEPNQDVDPQEQLPPDRAAHRTDGVGPEAASSVEVDLPGRAWSGESRPDAADDD